MNIDFENNERQDNTFAHTETMYFSFQRLIYIKPKHPRPLKSAIDE